MSDTGKAARPRQLTFAGGFVIGGSIFLVLSVFDTFTTLNSVEMRDQITDVLSSSTGEGLGLTLGEARSFMRVGLMVAAACGAAAAVLGVYALQGSRAARMALSVLAVPILLTAPLSDGLIGAFVAAATMMLWSGPARDWYAGRPVRSLEPPAPRSHPGPWEETMPSPEDRNRWHQPPPDAPPADQPGPPADGPPAERPRPETPPASSLSTAGSSTAPVATTGFGERAAQPAAPQQGTAWIPPTYAEVARGTAVPVTVRIACVLTWVFSGLVALLVIGAIVALIFAQDRIVDYVLDAPEWQRANLDRDVLLPVLWVGCLMYLGWALGACLLAWFAWRRHNWARWLLATSAAVTVLAGFLAGLTGVLHQLAAALTIAGLFSAAARTWYARQPWISGPPPGGPPLPPPGQPGWQPGPHNWPQGGPGYGPPPPDRYPHGAPMPGPDAGQASPDQASPDQASPDQAPPDHEHQGQSPGQSPGQPPGQSQGQPQGQQPPPGGKPPVW